MKKFKFKRTKLNKVSESRLESNEEKLAYVIKSLGLVTKEIAKKLGVSASLISQIKNH